MSHVEPGQPAEQLASDAAPPVPLIERMKSLDGWWITTVGDVARHTAALHLAPRSCPQPVIPADAYWIARPPA